MLIGPKYKICKRLGASVFEKCQTQKFQLAEARAPRKTRGKRGGGSDYGAQLLEKQKARFTYGLSEKQFAKYAEEAMGQKGASAEGLLARLESRLDNVVYRAGFTKTRRAARQMVSHGHITVNSRRMNIPSYAARPGDVITVREGSKTSPLFANWAETMTDHKTPAWMKVGDALTVTVETAPMIAKTEAPFSAATVIQFYSR